jgi:hypothetical protein
MIYLPLKEILSSIINMIIVVVVCYYLYYYYYYYYSSKIRPSILADLGNVGQKIIYKRSINNL